ncbi:MAG: hypothetical protein Fur0046_29940 [Cyanobacteria bacterium J069]|nr:MAG: hypothetical protein D6742_12520 [Cyanobacteria bacterium J069]
MDTPLNSFDLRAIAPLLPADQTLWLVLTLHCLIGLAGAGVAYYKGRNLGLWLFLGLTCGTAALLVALMMKRQPRPL